MCIYSFINLRYFPDNCGPSVGTSLTDCDIVEQHGLPECVSESEVCTQAFVCPLSHCPGLLPVAKSVFVPARAAPFDVCVLFVVFL